jgi:hypothetical protein
VNSLQDKLIENARRAWLTNHEKQVCKTKRPPGKTSRRPSQRLGGEQSKQYEGARPVLREMLQNLGVWCGQSAAENGLQNDGGGSVRHTMVWPRSPLFTNVSINHYFTGLIGPIRLSLSAVSRYNPAQVLGHMLGQKRRQWRGKSIG